VANESHDYVPVLSLATRRSLAGNGVRREERGRPGNPQVTGKRSRCIPGEGHFFARGHRTCDCRRVGAFYVKCPKKGCTQMVRADMGKGPLSIHLRGGHGEW